ncbi:MAG: Rpn family recombination-promoting nuclease/putative transposase, partial [Salinispira sp.]
IMDMNSIRIENTIYIDHGREMLCDLILIIPLKGEFDGLRIVLLIEHKSACDPKVSEQFDKYQRSLINSRTFQAQTDLLVLVLWYHGEQIWDGDISFHSSGDVHTRIPEKLYAMMEKYLARPKVLNRPVMVDVNRMSEDEFTRGSDGVVLTGGALCYIMRKVSKTGDEDLRKVAKCLKELPAENSREMIPNLLLYMKALKLDTRFEKINREINPEGEEVMMKKVQMSDWFVNQGMEKGILKGRVEGIRETARSMFLEGLSTEAVQRITGLSDEEMRTVRNGSH